MASTDLSTSDFDFDLPSRLIAQEPAKRREESRLLVLHRASGQIEHRRFEDITTYLQLGDVLVANRSRVIPARIRARKRSGGAVEFLLIRPATAARWTALARPGRKLRTGMELDVPGTALSVILRESMDDGEWLIEFMGDGDLEAQIRHAGQIPLPPYIDNPRAPLDRYQTVYADRDGSVAAPTAGLHFSRDLLSRIEQAGVQVHFVTLHVGPGTFKPVTTDDIRDHHMHAEWGEVPQATANSINESRTRGGRIVAVGTTTTRLLESAWRAGAVHPFCGDTSIFIHPGREIRAIDALVTNFHLPRSTLLMLVSAMAGRDLILHAYNEAIHHGYRFYSFGDAMLIL